MKCVGTNESISLSICLRVAHLYTYIWGSFCKRRKQNRYFSLLLILDNNYSKNFRLSQCSPRCLYAMKYEFIDKKNKRTELSSNEYKTYSIISSFVPKNCANSIPEVHTFQMIFFSESIFFQFFTKMIQNQRKKQRIKYVNEI